MRDAPSLAELRSKVFKHSRPGGREIGNVLAIYWGRPSAVYGTWLAVRLGLSAHSVTAMALGSQVMAAVAIGSGSRAGFVAGILLSHLAYWLDHVDGQVARWRGSSSLSGVYFDYMLHHVSSMTLGFALGFGLVLRGGSPFWALAGFSLALGWTCLGLNNDCRYKSFFQRLKVEAGPFLVKGGAGGSPRPPDGWPMAWPGVVTWPLAKMNEPHTVLLTLTALGGLAVARTDLWVAGWRAYVLGAGSVAVLLATARIARTIAGRAPDQEFARWFQPMPSPEPKAASAGSKSTIKAAASLSSPRP